MIERDEEHGCHQLLFETQVAGAPLIAGAVRWIVLVFAGAAALTQLGILYGENGLYAEALEQFQKMVDNDWESLKKLQEMSKS